MPDARKTLRNAADEVPLPKSRSSGTRHAKAMCAVRAFGLLEYMSLCRTQRLRFRPPKSGLSSARRREAMCPMQAFGLLEYSSLPARSVLRDESHGERSGRAFTISKAGSDAQGAQGRCVLNVRETLRNAAHQIPLPAGSQAQGVQRRCARCGPLAYWST